MIWGEKSMVPPELLPEKSHGQRSLVGCSPWGREESDTTERLQFHFSLSCTGEGNGNPLQCSCLQNPRDGGAWRAAVYRVAQSRTRLKWLRSSSRRSMIWGSTIGEMRHFPGPQGGPFAPGPRGYTAPLSGWMHDLPANARKSSCLPSAGPYLWVRVDRRRRNRRLQGGRVQTAAGPGAHTLSPRTAPRTALQPDRGHSHIRWGRFHTGRLCNLQDKRPERLWAQSSSTMEHTSDRRLASTWHQVTGAGPPLGSWQGYLIKRASVNLKATVASLP